MEIAVVDGHPEDGPSESDAFRVYLDSLVELIESKGHTVNHIRLARMDLKLCTGCWSCWVKTPGRCSQQDGSAQVIKSYLESDLVVFATPLSLGFLTALMKTMLDKLVALFLPHIEIHEGEFVHTNRYDRYPALGCLLHAGGHASEDLEVTREYFRRYAFHLKTTLALEAEANQSPEEVAHAIDSL